MEIIIDNLPTEVYEAYEVIEKLLSPDELILEKNSKSCECILLILNNLYYTNPK